MLLHLKGLIEQTSQVSGDSLIIQPYTTGNLKSIQFKIGIEENIISFTLTTNKSLMTRIYEISENIGGFYEKFIPINETTLTFADKITSSSNTTEIKNLFDLFYKRAMGIVENSQNIIIYDLGREYIFTEKRATHAFAVLKDLNWHTRTEIEGKKPDGTRKYGDPSRTVTVLEECGFDLSRSYTYENNQRMQQYKLNSIEQDVDNIKRRTTITKKMKSFIFERDNFRCAICQNTFEESFLEPDHKTPIQITGDEIDITDPNWAEKLQTMCKICNGRKREVCKKCTTFDCNNCPWCHPEQLLQNMVRISGVSYKKALENATALDMDLAAYIEELINSTKNVDL
ncbi:HNH endonuclease [Bacillus cereus]